MADFGFRRRFDSASTSKKQDFAVTETAITPGQTFETNYAKEEVKIPEAPKPVSSRRKRDTLLYTSIYHLPPIAITAFFTVIYVQEWTWPYPGPSDEVLAALQFAAKIHECLIIASISNILYHRIRFLLLQGDGVPLGLMTTPFQLNNPLYFVSPEFLGSLRTVASTFSLFLTFTLVVSVALLSLAASPFSAVILIPRELRLELPESHNLTQSLIQPPEGEPPSASWIQGPRDGSGTYLLEALSMPTTQMYPMSIGPSLNLTWRCPPLADRPGNCMSYFNQLFPDIVLSSMATLSKDFVEIPPSDLLIGGSKFRSTAFLTDFDIEAVGLNDTNLAGSAVRATCPLKLAFDNLIALSTGINFYRERFPNVPDVFTSAIWSSPVLSLPILQPQVLSQSCLTNIRAVNLTVDSLVSAPLNINNVGIELDGNSCFGTGFYPAFNFSFTESVASQLMSKNWTAGFLSFIDIQDSVPYPVSGGYVRVYPVDPSTPPQDREYQEIEIGYILAQWAKASPSSQSFIRGVSEPFIHPGEFETSFEDLLNKPDFGAVVGLDAAWLNALDIFPFEVLPPINTLPKLDANSRSLFNYVAESGNTHDVPMMVAAVMAGVHGAFGTLREDTKICTAPNNRGCTSRALLGERPVVYEYGSAINATAGNQVVIRVKLEQEAFGYSFKGGVTVILAFVFLYLHALLVLSHVVVVMAGFWSSAAWTSLTDLIVLGVGSAPSSLLRNAGAGVGSWRSWAFMASVRDVGFQRLELVIRDGDADWKSGVKPETGADVTVTFTTTRWITSTLVSTVSTGTSTAWSTLTSTAYDTITTTSRGGTSTTTVWITVTTTQFLRRAAVPVSGPTPPTTAPAHDDGDDGPFLIQGQTPISDALHDVLAEIGLLRKRAITSYVTLAYTSVTYSYSYSTVQGGGGAAVTSVTSTTVRSTLTSVVVEGASSTSTVTSTTTSAVVVKDGQQQQQQPASGGELSVSLAVAS
ncbi:hypothetical protein OQA88_7958 [Cercophora sp. LCS_1]